MVVGLVGVGVGLVGLDWWNGTDWWDCGLSVITSLGLFSVSKQDLYLSTGKQQERSG